MTDPEERPGPTDKGLDDKVALEQVIRSFSDSEVALQEIAAEAQRIRSATQQLGAAQYALEASNGAIATSAEALLALAGRLESCASSLRTTAERLAALDPQRVFGQLAALHQDIEAVGVNLTDTTNGIAEQLRALDKRLGRQTLWVALVLVVGAITLIVSVYGAQ